MHMMPFNIESDEEIEEDEEEHDHALLLPPTGTAPGVHVYRKISNMDSNNNDNETGTVRAQHQLLSKTDNSVYGWWDIRSLDRTRWLILAVCLTFIVFIVYNVLAWSSGAIDITAADAGDANVTLNRTKLNNTLAWSDSANESTASAADNTDMKPNQVPPHVIHTIEDDTLSGTTSANTPTAAAADNADVYQVPPHVNDPNLHNDTLSLSMGANDTIAADVTDAADVNQETVREPPYKNDTIAVVVDFNDDLPERDASKYLVYSSGCAMPSLDPYAADVMHLFHRDKYEPCDGRPPLTYVEISSTSSSSSSDEFADVWLRLNRTRLPLYNGKKAPIDRCCYQRINRAGENELADKKFTLGYCEPLLFDKGDAGTKLLPDVESVLVRCKSGTKELYSNTHAIARHRPDIRRRLDAFAAQRQQKQKQKQKQERQKHRAASTDDETLERPLSVLMLSIDSVSRLNLLRAMPKTAQHLTDNGWHELQGYNKIDDNTFPNVMAIMVGYNSSVTKNRCDPAGNGKLDACPFMWTEFRRAGYVTGYGEDETRLGTFTYGSKNGFQRPPTDYYMRPYMMAAEEHLTVKKRHALMFCLGDRHSVDHLFQFALDFAATYAGEPFFGLFWTNTFSHNNINDPTSMDNKMHDYLLQLEHRGVLNDSAVVFFSDHGIRFGDVRRLHTGWLEERLPFMFIWLPEWFRRARPDAVRALQSNRNRLTSPYDLHLWLKQVLQMSSGGSVVADGDGIVLATSESDGTESNGSEDVVGQLHALSCPACQSLFTTMPANRTCSDAAIEPHWCTCNAYEDQSLHGVIVVRAVGFVLKHINNELETYERDHPSVRSVASQRLCAHLKIKTVTYAGRMALSSATNGTDHMYLLVFDATPGEGLFEATVKHIAATDSFLMTASVSRLNMYEGQSECIPKESLRKYCYCSIKSKKNG